MKNSTPQIKGKVIITAAGDHGVVCEKVSAYPQEVTPQMVYNFLQGGAAINVLARHVGATVVVVDAGVAVDLQPHSGLLHRKIGYGTQNIACGAAMSLDQAVQSVEAGIEIAREQVEKGASILGTGEMGIGNTTPSSAIVAAITGEAVENVTGKGTGITDESFNTKVAVIKRALQVNAVNPRDGFDVLSKLGGFEIGLLAGVYLGGASKNVPVVIDGFISGAAALIAAVIEPRTRDYMIPSHSSVEKGHAVTLRHLGLAPLFDFDMRLGEGTGAALGISFVEAAVKILNEMATFKDAGVAGKAIN